MKFIKPFIVKILLIIIFLAVIMALFHGARFFLLVLAGALIAILWRGLATWIAKKTGASFRWLLPIVIIFNIGLLILFFILASPSVSTQMDRFSEKIPNVIEQIKVGMENSSVGRKILDSIRNKDFSEDQVKQMFNVFSGTFNFLIDLLLILAFAVFLCADPNLYKTGFLHLIPKKYHQTTKELFHRLDHILFRWFIGMFIDMFSIFVMISVGLWLLDMPMIFTFALIAFLFSFVPNIGPIISAIPPIAIALLESPQKALYVGLLYLGVQLFESYFVTPNVQKRATYLPPVLLLLVQFLMAKFLGVLGLFLSTPLLVMFIVIVNKLYVEEYLGNYSVEVGQKQRAEAEGQQFKSPP